MLRNVRQAVGKITAFLTARSAYESDNSIYDGLTKEQVSHGTVTMRIVQQIGGAFGTALLAIVFQHYLLSGNSPENIFIPIKILKKISLFIQKIRL
jgi:hypothetical protein